MSRCWPGTALAAHAQSVSSLPPNGGAPARSALTQPYSSTHSFFPKPGGAEVSKAPAQHPDTASGVGPRPR
jgi:hypothetical protein